MVKNGGFEEGMKHWGVLGKPEKATEEGWKVEISKDAYQGNASLHVLADRSAAGKTPGVWQEPRIFASPSTGKSFIISCWVKAGGGATNSHGIYCGAGSAMSLYSSDWKRSLPSYARTGSTDGKWVRAMGKPVEAADWCKAAQMSAGLSYTAGEAWIDDVRVTEAYVNLAISVKGGAMQVIVEDETGSMALDSGPLPGNTSEYTKNVKVQAGHTYTIKALNKDGAITKKDMEVE
jgi:hypothetical protein